MNSELFHKGGEFLKWQDLGGRDVTVTIKDAYRHTFEAGEQEDTQPDGSTRKPGEDTAGVVSFVGKDKKLRLNVINLRCFQQLFGIDTDTWIGKDVTLFGDPTIRFGRSATGGIRVKGAPTVEEPITVSVSKGKKARPEVRVLVKTQPAKRAEPKPE